MELHPLVIPTWLLLGVAFLLLSIASRRSRPQTP